MSANGDTPNKLAQAGVEKIVKFTLNLYTIASAIFGTVIFLLNIFGLTECSNYLLPNGTLDIPFFIVKSYNYIASNDIVLANSYYLLIMFNIYTVFISTAVSFIYVLCVKIFCKSIQFQFNDSKLDIKLARFGIGITLYVIFSNVLVIPQSRFDTSNLITDSSFILLLTTTMFIFLGISVKMTILYLAEHIMSHKRSPDD